MNYIYKEVNFNKYCNTCVHRKEPENHDICHECLNNGYNTNSEKPTQYEFDWSDSPNKPYSKEDKNENSRNSVK